MAERKKVQKVKLSGNNGHSAKPQAKKSGFANPSKRINKKTEKAVKPAAKQRPVSDEKIVMMPTEKKAEKVRRSSEAPKPKTAPTTKKIAMERTPAPVKRRPANTSGQRAKKSGPNLSIILGKKRETRRKRLITYMVVFPFVLAILLFCLLTPTGPIEAITNGVAVIGGGEYPKSVIGSRISSLKTEDNRAFLLTNTHISGYTAAGKTMFEYQHDFSNPVLRTSGARSLVYNRESTGFIVCNNSNLLYKKDLENAIYCADIADNGSVVFATDSDRYSAQVEVFARGMKSKFIWYLVNGLVSDVAISNNGKRIAIAVLKVENGAYSSEISCFNINSETPAFTISVPGTPVLKLENISSGKFAYATEKGISFVSWKNGTEMKTEESGLAPAFFKTKGKETVVVFGKNTSSTINIYDSDGNKKHSFSYNSLADDISVYGDRVYILKSSKIYVMDLDGNLLETKTSEQPLWGIAASQNGVFAVDNLSVSHFK